MKNSFVIWFEGPLPPYVDTHSPRYPNLQPFSTPAHQMHVQEPVGGQRNTGLCSGHWLSRDQVSKSRQSQSGGGRKPTSGERDEGRCGF